MQTVTVTSERLDQDPQVEKPKSTRSSAVETVLLLSKPMPPYCRSAAGVELTESSGETNCNSSGVTSDSTVVGKLPLQVGPGSSDPVQTSVPLRFRLVVPVALPLVTIASS